MKRILGVVGILVVVLAVVAAGFFFLRPLQDQSTAADDTAPTAFVTRGNIQEIVSATGNVVAAQQASLTFETSGPIADVLVEKGQEVEHGQVMARLDTASLEWQVDRAQASLETAQARLAQAQKPASEEDLASAQAALDSAKASYERVQEGASAEDLASARAALDSARANYDQVKAGPTEEELAAAKAQVDSARAQVRQAQAAYDRIKNEPDAAMRQEALNLQTATISLEQAQANYDAQANRPTASELAAAEAQVAQAEAQLAALLEKPTSDLASAEAQVSQAEANLEALLKRPNPEDIAIQEALVKESTVALAQAQSQLDDAVIQAPFAGTVLDVNVNVGEWASPGAPAIVLATMRKMILDVNVDEVDVAQLAEGQPAYLSFDALEGEVVTGTVTYIASSSTSVGGAVAYGVEIRFDPGPLPARLGMTADVDIVVASAEDVLLIPNQALEIDREAGRTYVTLQQAGGATERKEVLIGLRDETHTQVLEGVAEGAELVMPEIPERSLRQQPFGPSGQGGGPFGEGGG
jgi:HlyD family secretion protein